MNILRIKIILPTRKSETTYQNRILKSPTFSLGIFGGCIVFVFIVVVVVVVVEVEGMLSKLSYWLVVFGEDGC